MVLGFMRKLNFMASLYHDSYTFGYKLLPTKKKWDIKINDYFFYLLTTSFMYSFQ